MQVFSLSREGGPHTYEIHLHVRGRKYTFDAWYTIYHLPTWVHPYKIQTYLSFLQPLHLPDDAHVKPTMITHKICTHTYILLHTCNFNTPMFFFFPFEDHIMSTTIHFGQMQSASVYLILLV